MVKDRVLKTIKEHNLISKGDHVVLGLSGGPDSSCLFYVLKDLQSELKFTLHAVHVNHMMRDIADEDQRFAEKMCKDSGIDYMSFVVDCNWMAKEEGLTAEEAGRKARYQSFAAVADQIAREEYSDNDNRVVKIAVAHNSDDQAETVLFRVLRGTGTDGIAGMEYSRSEGKHLVIRPLMDVARKDIEKYCSDNGIDTTDDETNHVPLYARNKIRLDLLPLIKREYNKNIVDGLGRMARIAAADKDYIWAQTKDAWDKVVVEVNKNSVVFNKAKVAEQHESIRQRLALMALQHIGLSKDVTNERLTAYKNMIDDTGNETKVIQLPHGYEITFAFGDIYFKKANAISDGEENIHVSLIDDPMEVAHIKSRIASRSYDDNAVWLDAAKVAAASGFSDEYLANVVEIRSRKEGDFICLNSGTKKIKKLLGELKIPADERGRVRIVAAGKCALCVKTSDGRKRYAETLKITNGTNAILEVKFV